MLGVMKKVKSATWKLLISFFKDHICHSTSEIKSLIYIFCLFESCNLCKSFI